MLMLEVVDEALLLLRAPVGRDLPELPEEGEPFGVKRQG
tara:strand:- start:401 stop:517 length:117 start_codon:yes stop_codon:yes gene_type:complete